MIQQKDIPARTKKLIIQKTGGICGFCGESDVSTLEFHHIRGKQVADPHVPDNLIYVCKNCHGKITACQIGNIVSTSMLRNSAKANWTLEELGWTIRPPGNMSQWDGMLSWCMNFLKKDASLLKDDYIGRWYKAAISSPSPLTANDGGK